MNREGRFTTCRRHPCFYAARLLPALLFYSPGAALPAAAAKPPPPPAAAVSPAGANLPQSDARLNRTVTLNEIGTPLDELLEKLSDDSLTLSCGRSCAAQKVQIRLKERPLRALMAALAEMLPGAWRRRDDGSGYRLEMDPKAVARRERWWKLFLAERERALAAQRAQVLATMRDRPFRRKPGDPNPEKSDLALETAADDHDLFRSLPPGLQESIASRMNDVIDYGGMIGTGSTNDATVVPFGDLPRSVQDDLRRRGSGNPRLGGADFSWDNAVVRFTNKAIVVSASVDFPDGRATGIGFHLSVNIGADAAALSLNQSRLAAETQRRGRAAPPAWKQLAAYRESRVWENDPPPAGFRASFQPPRRADVLAWLGEKGEIEFVADYYSLPGQHELMKPQEKTQRLERPLKEELDRRAVEQDMSWKRREDKVYLFRHNRWYRDDYREVPAPLLRRWLAKRLPPEHEKSTEPAPAAALPPTLTLTEALRQQMEWQAEVVGALTYWQITGGLKGFTQEEPGGPAADAGERRKAEEAHRDRAAWLSFSLRRQAFSVDSDILARSHGIARFYAGLDAGARAALVEGRLDVAALRPEQQAQAVTLVPALSAAKADNDDTRLGLRFNAPPRDLRWAAIGTFPVRLLLIPAEAEAGDMPVR